MRRCFVPGAALALLAVASCGERDSRAPQQSAARPPASGAAPGPADRAGVTPMAERVAVLGVLNKRNGIVRDVTLKPGQAAKGRDLIVRLRACETTAPWEAEKLTGAFVQLDVQRPDRQWQRVFSGWLYRESPSLNVVEHPVYDVWPKSCAMTYPSGPGASAAPVASRSRSSAPKSGAAPRRAPAPARERPAAPAPAEPAPAPVEPTPAPPTPPPSAPESNLT